MNFRPCQVAGVGLALGLLVLCVACSPHRDVHPRPIEEGFMKPEQTRGEIIDLYEKTRAVLGGTWVVGAQTWFECSSREGVTGAHFDFESERRDGELPASAKDIAEQVRRLWASQGIHASTWIDTGRRPYQHWVSFPEFGAGSESDGYLVQFVASDGGQADFSGSGRCAEGNAYDLELAEPRPTPEPPATPTRFP